MRSWLIAGAVLASAPATARAGQCTLVDESAAIRALDVIRRHDEIVAYCEPCGDVAPQPPEHIILASSERTAGGRELRINGAAVDLAYTYVPTSSHRYENLAALVGCPTTGVSPSLAVDDATSTGVLIHADGTPVRSDPVVERVAPPPSGPPLDPPPAIYVVTSQQYLRIGWDMVALACVATTALWWLGSGVRRRRRAMRPRATDL